MSNPMKYYLRKGHHDKQPVTVEGQVFNFEPVNFFAGQWWALYSTNDPEEIELLEKAINTQGVKEISPEDAAKYLKKKQTSAPNVTQYTNSVLDRVQPPQPDQNAEPAEASEATETVDSESNPSKSDPAAERSVDDLITPQTIKPKSGPFASSQKQVADALGMGFEKFRADYLKAEGNPGKTDAGYDINAWKAFVNAK